MSTIFCFSSTGNSLYVAKSIAEKINADVLSMSKPVTSCSDDVIGFVFPIYFCRNDIWKVHQKTESALKIVVDDIVGKKSNKPASYTFINTISHSMFPAQKDDCDKNFIIRSSCTHCGCCAAICPVSNITMQNEPPTFHHHCEHCLACMHICPAGAVQWKSKPYSFANSSSNVIFNTVILYLFIPTVFLMF